MSVWINQANVKTLRCPRRRVFDGIDNPRGLCPTTNGRFYLAVAGDGSDGTGRVIKLSRAGDEVRQDGVVLADLPSMSVVRMFKRDGEIMGPSAFAKGPEGICVVVNDLRATDTVYALDEPPRLLFDGLPGNVHTLMFSAARNRWYGVRPNIGDLIALHPGKGAEIVVAFASLDAGQDPIPVALRPEPATGQILVALMSGEVDGTRGVFAEGPAGETGEDGGRGPGGTLVADRPKARLGSAYGNNFLQGHGRIVAVDLDTGKVESRIDGLTLPVDFLPYGEGMLVLELCAGFLEPLLRPGDFELCRHGGFQRFSGRLLFVDPASGAATELASGLDMPSNLTLDGEDGVWISQGAGTPGRPIPGPDGRPTVVAGFVDAVDLSPLQAG